MEETLMDMLGACGPFVASMIRFVYDQIFLFHGIDYQVSLPKKPQQSNHNTTTSVKEEEEELN